MKTTDLKTSKELAEALEGAGYIIKSNAVINSISGKNTMISNFGYNEKTNIKDYILAFTMCELWDMLPASILIDNYYFELRPISERFYHGDTIRFMCYFGDIETERVERNSEFEASNPCNALARLVLWCIENGHKLNLNK